MGDLAVRKHFPAKYTEITAMNLSWRSNWSACFPTDLRKGGPPLVSRSNGLSRSSLFGARRKIKRNNINVVLLHNTTYDDVTLYDKNRHTPFSHKIFFSLPENTFCRRQISLNFRGGKQVQTTKSELSVPQPLRSPETQLAIHGPRHTLYPFDFLGHFFCT